MRVSYLGGLVAGQELLTRELANGLEHEIAGSTDRSGIKTDQSLVNQRGEGAQNIEIRAADRANRFGGFQRKAAHEDTEPAEHHCSGPVRSEKLQAMASRMVCWRAGAS